MKTETIHRNPDGICIDGKPVLKAAVTQLDGKWGWRIRSTERAYIKDETFLRRDQALRHMEKQFDREKGNA